MTHPFQELTRDRAEISTTPTGAQIFCYDENLCLEWFQICVISVKLKLLQVILMSHCLRRQTLILMQDRKQSHETK